MKIRIAKKITGWNPNHKTNKKRFRRFRQLRPPYLDDKGRRVYPSIKERRNKMIRTKLTALMYAAAFVTIVAALLTGVIYFITSFPVACTTIAVVGLLCIYYKTIYKELKSRKEDKE